MYKLPGLLEARVVMLQLICQWLKAYLITLPLCLISDNSVQYAVLLNSVVHSKHEKIYETYETYPMDNYDFQVSHLEEKSHQFK